jgi:hypothetical protein
MIVPGGPEQQGTQGLGRERDRIQDLLGAFEFPVMIRFRCRFPVETGDRLVSHLNQHPLADAGTVTQFLREPIGIGLVEGRNDDLGTRHGREYFL